MMTRKDYKAVAEAIDAALDMAAVEHETNNEHAAIMDVAMRLADVFGEDNPRFDRDRFMAACGF